MVQILAVVLMVMVPVIFSMIMTLSLSYVKKRVRRRDSE